MIIIPAVEPQRTYDNAAVYLAGTLEGKKTRVVKGRLQRRRNVFSTLRKEKPLIFTHTHMVTTSL